MWTTKKISKNKSNFLLCSLQNFSSVDINDANAFFLNIQLSFCVCLYVYFSTQEFSSDRTLSVVDLSLVFHIFDFSETAEYILTKLFGIKYSTSSMSYVFSDCSFNKHGSDRLRYMFVFSFSLHRCMDSTNLSGNKYSTSSINKDL